MEDDKPLALSTFDAIHKWIHDILHLTWCREHPVACAIITILGLLIFGLTLVRLVRGREGA